MDDWLIIQLSPSKRPILFDGELEVIIQEGVALYEGDKLTKFEKGILTLTTHRLIWCDGNTTSTSLLSPMALPLEKITDVEAENNAFKLTSSSKIRVILSGRQKPVRISFRSGGRDNFLVKFRTCLKNRAWDFKSSDSSSKLTVPSKKDEFETKKAGISGIIRIEETKSKQTDQMLQAAFSSDIKALMEKAKEMVSLSERFAQQLRENSDQGSVENSELQSVLISMGIVSPVTKENAGSLYHSQLARQLADWLEGPLGRTPGTMLTLVDLFCVFNRARLSGTALVSPDDLLRACMLFEDLHLPLRMRRFEGSGVLVVHGLNCTDEMVAKQIADLLRIEGPLSPFDVSKAKNISITLAQEQLLTAERMEVVCRDETYEGIVFYLNFFLNPQSSSTVLR